MYCYINTLDYTTSCIMQHAIYAMASICKIVPDINKLDLRYCQKELHGCLYPSETICTVGQGTSKCVHSINWKDMQARIIKCLFNPKSFYQNHWRMKHLIIPPAASTRGSASRTIIIAPFLVKDQYTRTINKWHLAKPISNVTCL